jgi:ferredoxin-type protein NapH
MKNRQNIRAALILLSFFLFPATFYYLSPVLIVQAAAEGVVNGSFIMFALLFVSSLVLGRAFCGWVCPGAGCQEAVFQANGRPVHRGNSIKWMVWVPWIGLITALAVRRGGYERVDFLYETLYGLSISHVQGLMAYLMVLLILIVLPAFAVGKRSFCHHLCWMAPFMILGRKIRNGAGWPSLSLAVRPGSCTRCGECVPNCPMSLPVMDMVSRGEMEHSECILCASCIDSCDFDTLSYKFFRHGG